jgi:hypothetical protein
VAATTTGDLRVLDIHHKREEVVRARIDSCFARSLGYEGVLYGAPCGAMAGADQV